MQKAQDHTERVIQYPVMINETALSNAYIMPSHETDCEK